MQAPCGVGVASALVWPARFSRSLTGATDFLLKRL